MHDSVFDRYREGNSLIHRLDPRVKVVVTVGLILSNALLPDGAWAAFAFSWALVLLGNALAGLGMDFTFRRSFVALPFALVAVTAVFSLPGRALFEGDLGPWHLVVTEAGVVRFASVLLRAWLSVQVAILLIATTRFPDLLHALEHLHLPSLLVTTIAFLYRYMFVLTDEVLRMTRARQARSALLPGRRGGGTVSWRARVAGNMVGQLFLRSYERSERIYQAMLARGYRGQIRTLAPHVLRGGDYLFALAALLGVLLIQLVGRL
ncbi:MAG: cobalt ECF transporter T component CbiQ [Anaerolineae bacterium]|nr:MAG: cobalt ECF transporter T component CbiQ [Anaerolineae bacterium]